MNAVLDHERTEAAKLRLPEFEIIRAATLAPSPDNNQPWRFSFDGQKLLIFDDPARGLPSDVCSMFALQALGAAVENVVIEATRHGLLSDVKFVASGRSPAGEAPVAEVRFSPGADIDSLTAALEPRCTNRHAYSRKPVPNATLDQITAATRPFDGCHLSWLTGRASIRRISKLIAVSDRLRFERQEFHAELFRQLRLTRSDAERTRDGLDLRTLGLPPGGGLLLRSLRSWPFVRALNRFGLSRMLTVPSASLVRRSGAIGVLTVAKPTAASFFAAGRAFERLWLTATALGMSVHPQGSLPIFVAHHELLAGRSLDSRQAHLAAALSQSFRDLVLDVGGNSCVIAFRMGRAKRGAARSLRRPVNEVLDSVRAPIA